MTAQYSWANNLTEFAAHRDNVAVIYFRRIIPLQE
jgi:hypothetical protein